MSQDHSTQAGDRSKRLTQEVPFWRTFTKSHHGSGLYLVPTPLGNLADITIRALQLLDEADLILCEDTRMTRRLLDAYGIATKLTAYNDVNAPKVRDGILERLRQGAKIALVSDAGMPCISDPGYKLVAACYIEKIHVEALPGPVAFITAAAASGLPTDRICFHGFVARKTNEIEKAFKSLQPETTHTFYESPNRLVQTLEILEKIPGKRQICVARELTKKFEEKKVGSAQELLSYYQEHPPKGEIVLLIHEQRPNHKLEDFKEVILKALDEGERVKDIARFVAEQSPDLSSKDAYNYVLTLKASAGT